MKTIKFTKIVASGNDFIIVEPKNSRTQELKNFAKTICNRKYGVGADGLLILEKSKIADIKMRIFNADGSEAEMCGNGARCVALYVSAIRNVQYAILKIETKAGVIESSVCKDNARIKLTNPRGFKLNIPITVNNRILHVNYIDTGVPHAVIFVEGLDKIDIAGIGRNVRNHKEFAPRGTNVDFIEILNKDKIKVRTYERGVEDETLACGTGAVASALLYAILYPLYSTHRVNVFARSGEILRVYFERINNGFKNVWLEGNVREVYKGAYYV